MAGSTAEKELQSNIAVLDCVTDSGASVILTFSVHSRLVVLLIDINFTTTGVPIAGFAAQGPQKNEFDVEDKFSFSQCLKTQPAH